MGHCSSEAAATKLVAFRPTTASDSIEMPRRMLHRMVRCTPRTTNRENHPLKKLKPSQDWCQLFRWKSLASFLDLITNIQMLVQWIERRSTCIPALCVRHFRSNLFTSTPCQVFNVEGGCQVKGFLNMCVPSRCAKSVGPQTCSESCPCCADSYLHDNHVTPWRRTCRSNREHAGFIAEMGFVRTRKKTQRTVAHTAVVGICLPFRPQIRWSQINFVFRIMKPVLRQVRFEHNRWNPVCLPT